MRRLRLLALALGVLTVRAEEHIPYPNVEFNITLPMPDTSAEVGVPEWATAYANTNGTAGERGTPGVGPPSLVRNSTSGYPTIRLPGGLRAVYIYGKANGVGGIKFRYAGDETLVDGIAADGDGGLLAKIEDLEWFKRTPNGQYSNVDVVFQGQGGAPLPASAKPVIEQVVVTTGIQSQGKTIADAKVTTWPLLNNYIFDTRGGALTYENSSTILVDGHPPTAQDIIALGPEVLASSDPDLTELSRKTGRTWTQKSVNWTLSYDYAFSVTSGGDWGVFKLDGPTFAVAPPGTSLHISVPANTSWIGINATRGPAFGDLGITENVKIDGYAAKPINTKDVFYGKDQLVWFRSLDPRVKYNITVFSSLLDKKSAIGLNSVTFYSGLGDGEYPDPNAVKTSDNKNGQHVGNTGGSKGSSAAPAKSHKSKAGAIAGGVVGGVISLLLLILLLWCCVRRRRRAADSSKVTSYFDTPVTRYASGPATPAPATLKSDSYTPHGYGGAYEPLPRHSHSNSQHSYPFAGYEQYEPWGTGSLRSESALAVNSGSDVGVNTVTATGGAPVSGARLERKASIKKRAGVPWPLVTRGSNRSGNSKTPKSTARGRDRAQPDSQQQSESNSSSERSGITTPVTAASGYSMAVPWGLQAQGFGAGSTTSVPLSAVGLPSSGSGPAPWQDVPRALDAGSVTEEDLMDPPLYNPAWSVRPRAQNAHSEETHTPGTLQVGGGDPPARHTN